jgi:hypothetical protein
MKCKCLGGAVLLFLSLTRYGPSLSLRRIIIARFGVDRLARNASCVACSENQPRRSTLKTDVSFRW